MKKILIIGLGLIGSSIALGIKRGQAEVEISALDKPESLDYGLSQGIIDEGVTDFAAAACESDLIFLATPISVSLDFMEKLSELPLKEGVIITDTGSTKTEIARKAEEVFKTKKVRFIAGHPMAGSHKSGVRAADVNLFENAYYVLSEENQDLQDLLAGLHARFIIIAPEEHDRVTSQVSHFPHVLASSLVLQSDQAASEHPLVRHLAAGGFRDMTRIAESDSEMWTSVLMTNPDNIIERIENFQKELEGVKQIISEQDAPALKKFFEKGKKVRQNMEIHKGAIPNFYDLFISVPDAKGVVLRVLALLQDISISNVKINEENREDIHGTLQLSFKSESDLLRAKEIVEVATDFEVRRP